MARGAPPRRHAGRDVQEGGLRPPPLPSLDRFETLLRCPDCHGDLARDAADTLACACGYRAPNEGGVYNLLPAAYCAPNSTPATAKM